MSREQTTILDDVPRPGDPLQTTRTEGSAPRVPRPTRALVVLVIGSFLAYAALGHFVTTPRIFYDELIYMEAAESLAAGHSPQVREGPYEYGILYPAVLAPVLWAAPNREVGYELAKVLNALLFALTVVPIYLLARRMLRPSQSVVVAGLSVAIPSAVYVSVVMTESLAYLAASCALYAIVLALERPTATRQFAALGTIAIAYLARPQFLALYVALLLGLGLTAALVPVRRAAWWSEARRAWPAWLSLVAGVFAFVVVPLAGGTSPQEKLGRYQDLWRSYDVLTVAKWLVFHVADLDLYLAVVPFAIAPMFVASLLDRARSGREREGAFLALFLSVNAAMLAVVAVVVTYQESSGSGTQRLHDRYLFYVVPLWLIGLFAWFENGTPRPPWARRVGVGLAVVFAGLLPLGDVNVNDGAKLFSAVGTGFPGIVGKIVDPAFLVGRLFLMGMALALVLLVLRGNRPLRGAVSALVLLFLVNASLAWGHAFSPPEGKVFAGSADERRWVDERVSAGVDVDMVSLECAGSSLVRDSFFETEFFNESVGRIVQIGGDFSTGRVTRDGRVLRSAGQALRSPYVVVGPGIEVRGHRIGSGTAAGLTLWRVDGPVQIVDVRSMLDLQELACAQS